MLEKDRKIEKDCRFSASEDRGRHTRLLSSSISLLSPFISFYLLFILAGVCLLSSCGADNHLKKGDQFYAIGEYFDAAAEYKKAYARTKTTEKEKRGIRAWKMAECYRKINYNAKAIGAYQNAVRYNYPDTLAWLYLAQLQHKQGDYKTAIKNYKTYLEMVPGAKLAINGIQGCMQAPIWKNKPTLYSIKKEPILSSRRADYSPMLLGSEADQLYFSTTRPQATGAEISGLTGTKSSAIFFSKKMVPLCCTQNIQVFVQLP